MNAIPSNSVWKALIYALYSCVAVLKPISNWLTLGVGSFAHKFDHMQELTGREAEKVIASQKQEAAQ